MPKDTEKRRKITAMREAGLSVREIAGALHLTTQRIYQLLDDLEDDNQTEVES